MSEVEVGWKGHRIEGSSGRAIPGWSGEKETPNGVMTKRSNTLRWTFARDSISTDQDRPSERDKKPNLTGRLS